MKSRFLILFLLIWVCGFTYLAAQEEHPQVILGNVEDAINYALLHNPDLEVYQLQGEKAQKEYKASKSFRWPAVSGNVLGQKNIHLSTTPLPGEIFGQPGETIEAQFGQKYNYNAGITLSKSILDWQARMTSKIYEKGIDIANARKEAFAQNLSEQVSLYYYTAIISKRAVEINEKDLAIADSISSFTRQKYEEGLVDQFVMNRAEMNANNIKQSMASSTTLYEQCVHQLKILSGVDAGTNFLFGEAVKKTTDFLPEKATLLPDKNIDILAYQFTQSEFNVKVQKAAFLPKLSIYRYWGKQQYNSDSGISFDDGSWNDYSYVALNISVPIFSGFARSNKLKTVNIERKIAETILQNEQNKAEIKDSLLVKEYENSLDVVRASYENFILSGENRGLALKKYEQGIIGMEDYFKAFDDYLVAENAYLNALSTMYSYYATIISRN